MNFPVVAVTPTGDPPDNEIMPMLGFPQERTIRSPMDNYNIYTCVVGRLRFFVWPTHHHGGLKWVVDFIGKGLHSDSVGELQDIFRVAPTYALVEFNPLAVQAVIHEISKERGRDEAYEATAHLGAVSCYPLVRDEKGYLSVPRDGVGEQRSLPMVAPFVMYNYREGIGVTIFDKERE